MARLIRRIISKATVFFTPPPAVIETKFWFSMYICKNHSISRPEIILRYEMFWIFDCFQVGLKNTCLADGWSRPYVNRPQYLTRTWSWIVIEYFFRLIIWIPVPAESEPWEGLGGSGRRGLRVSAKPQLSNGWASFTSLWWFHLTNIINNTPPHRKSIPRNEIFSYVQSSLSVDLDHSIMPWHSRSNPSIKTILKWARNICEESRACHEYINGGYLPYQDQR